MPSLPIHILLKNCHVQTPFLHQGFQFVNNASPKIKFPLQSFQFNKSNWE
jgi:hypothetical protein